MSSSDSDSDDMPTADLQNLSLSSTTKPKTEPTEMLGSSTPAVGFFNFGRVPAPGTEEKHVKPQDFTFSNPSALKVVDVPKVFGTPKQTPATAQGSVAKKSKSKSLFDLSPEPTAQSISQRPSMITAPRKHKDKVEEEDEDVLLARHLRWLKPAPNKELSELESAPLFTRPVLLQARSIYKRSGGDPSENNEPFSQHGLLGGSAGSADPRIFYNVAAPSSAFICGSQGSGKTYTLSCLLENCLLPSHLGKLPRPLTGLLFHYDTFVSDHNAEPCEAAYLSSHPHVKVRVLCPPTNFRNMKETYALLPNVTVEELRLDESSLNTKRMLDLMVVGSGAMPLYLHVVQRVLRDLRIEQQQTRSAFNYRLFRSRMENEDLRPDQRAPLQQRLETLESFMAKEHTLGYPQGKAQRAGTDWTPKKGQLTIVDLSCPCVTPEMACSLFNICLSLFVEQDDTIGRVIALDEAHKYMSNSAECQSLTNSLLSTIRLQRHLGARVIISTQEPTISPKLLDLCSITIVHRFTSPDWLRVLGGHLAGISTASKLAQIGRHDETDDLLDGFRGIEITKDATLELFSHIVELNTGEALVFAPNAVVSLRKRKGPGDVITVSPKRLAHGVLRISIRPRITDDGGESVMAS